MELLAMRMVMEAELQLGNQPRDVSAEKCGYDVESRVQSDGRLRFIEVKGRVTGALTVTVTRNEILTALNKPEDFILAIGQVEDGQRKLIYVRQPFQQEPDFSVESINYNLRELLATENAATQPPIIKIRPAPPPKWNVFERAAYDRETQILAGNESASI